MLFTLLCKKNDAAGTVDIAGVTELAVNYVNGPLTAVYAQSQVKTGANAYLNALTVNATSTMSILGASYAVMPTLKLHAGLGRSTSSGFAVASTTPYDTSSYQVGATYNVTPVITLMAQMAKVNDKSATNTDRTLTGAGLDYNFSKTARAYVRYDNINYASSGTVTAGTKQTRTAVGISKSF